MFEVVSEIQDQAVEDDLVAATEKIGLAEPSAEEVVGKYANNNYNNDDNSSDVDNDKSINNDDYNNNDNTGVKRISPRKLTGTDLDFAHVVVNDCNGHCDCISCTKCLYCHTCDECIICIRCSKCLPEPVSAPELSPKPVPSPVSVLQPTKRTEEGVARDLLRFGYNINVAPRNLSKADSDTNREFYFSVYNLVRSVEKRLEQWPGNNYVGIIRLSDSQIFFATISIPGFNDIPIPRTACYLIYMIPEADNLTWYTIDTLGDQYLGLRQIGIYVRNHIDTTGRLSVEALVTDTTTSTTTTTTTTTTTCNVPKMSPGVVLGEGPSAKRRRSNESEHILSPTSVNNNNSEPSVNNIDVAEEMEPEGNRVNPEFPGFPSAPPFRLSPPTTIRWPESARNQGTPAERQRHHKRSVVIVPMVRGYDGRVPQEQYRAREINEEKEVCGEVALLYIFLGFVQSAIRIKIDFWLCPISDKNL